MLYTKHMLCKDVTLYTRIWSIKCHIIWCDVVLMIFGAMLHQI